MDTRLGRALARIGVYAGRLRKRPFGQDMLYDIRRLSAARGAPVRSVFDVGANIGQSAHKFTDTFPAARIHSFEPHPATFAELRRNTAGLERVTIHNLALGDEAGTVPFYEYDNSLINSRIPDAAYPLREGMKPRSIEVEQQTLDGFCAAADIGHIDFLKVDTESFDDRVLMGARELLERRAIRLISCEVSLSNEGRVTTATDLAELLAPFGYTLSSIYFDYVILTGRPYANGNALFLPFEEGPLDSIDQSSVS